GVAGGRKRGGGPPQVLRLLRISILRHGQTPMTALHLLSGPTPNGRKVAIMLHECGLAYEATFIDILAGDQLAPDFLALNPNNKHPVLIDAEGPDGSPITVWESGAILIYLAEKCAWLIPTDARRRIETVKWLFFQVANQGPYRSEE